MAPRRNLNHRNKSAKFSTRGRLNPSLHQGQYWPKAAKNSLQEAMRRPYEEETHHPDQFNHRHTAATSGRGGEKRTNVVLHLLPGELTPNIAPPPPGKGIGKEPESSPLPKDLPLTRNGENAPATTERGGTESFADARVSERLERNISWASNWERAKAVVVVSIGLTIDKEQQKRYWGYVCNYLFVAITLFIYFLQIA